MRLVAVDHLDPVLVHDDKFVRWQLNITNQVLVPSSSLIYHIVFVSTLRLNALFQFKRDLWLRRSLSYWVTAGCLLSGVFPIQDQRWALPQLLRPGLNLLLGTWCCAWDWSAYFWIFAFKFDVNYACPGIDCGCLIENWKLYFCLIQIKFAVNKALERSLNNINQAHGEWIDYENFVVLASAENEAR